MTAVGGNVTDAQVGSLIGDLVDLQLSVAVAVAGCRELGLDVVTWTQRGLVDAISTSHFLNTDFFQPLAEMRAALGQAAVPIYGGFDLEHGAQRHSPESLRAAVSGLYDSGADGINIFNFPCWIEKIGAVPYDWLLGLESPATAARKPLLYSVPTVRFRRAYELPGLLPAKLHVSIATARGGDARCARSDSRDRRAARRQRIHG